MLMNEDWLTKKSDEEIRASQATAIRDLGKADLESVSGGFRLCGDLHYDVVEI